MVSALNYTYTYLWWRPFEGSKTTNP